MKKFLPALFAVAMAIVLSAFTKPPIGYTYIYQGPPGDLINELRDPMNWVRDGYFPTFSCGGGTEVSCSFTTYINCDEFGEDHLNLDTEIVLVSGPRPIIQFITLYIPVLADFEFADMEY